MNTPKPAPPKKGLTFNERTHRYRLDGHPVRGVTSILNGGIPKPLLMPWYAAKVADWVLDPANRGELNSLLSGDMFQARQFLKGIPERARDAAALRGTEIHGAAEALATNGDADVPEEHLSAVEGYLEFLDAWQIEPILVEAPVASRGDKWAGTVDMIARSPYLCGGKPVLLDLKTSRGIYPDTALQCAAYAMAEFTGLDGDEKHLPLIHGTYVAHVTGERTDIYELSGSPDKIREHYEMFLHAKAVVDDRVAREKLIGAPLPYPVDTTATR